MAAPSAWMDSVVLTNPDLVSFIQKHFVSLRIDMPKTQEGRKLAERYKIKFYAHYLILDEKEKLYTGFPEEVKLLNLRKN